MNEQNNKKWSLSREQKTWGLTALLVICIGILFFFAVYRWNGVADGFSTLGRVFQPFIIGAVLAWLLVPLYNACERLVWPRLTEKNYKRGRSISKLICGAVSIVVLLGLIAAFFAMVLPGLVQSVSTVVANSQDYLDTVTGWGQKFLENNPSVQELFNQYSQDINERVTDWAKNTLLPQLTSMLGTVSTHVVGIFKILINFIIGIFACIYLLNAKRTLAGQAKRIVYSIFGAKKANTIVTCARRVDKIFSGFISGKVWDSLIIGLLCFVCCSIMKMPYTLLVSVIVGITNIIPCFGPFIGAIPSALLILVDSPIKCVYFIIFIIVLQQVDGNIIGPKILGDSVGISPLWILFSIVIFGGFFGFMGMLLGVPVFTCIYTLARWLIKRSLTKKDLPTETEDYKKLILMDTETNTPVEYDSLKFAGRAGAGKEKSFLSKEIFPKKKKDAGGENSAEQNGQDGPENK